MRDWGKGRPVVASGSIITKERVVTARTGLFGTLLVGIVVGAFLLGSHTPPVFSAADREGGGPHYSVVATEGHNLIVTDNQTNKLYFYTIDKDKEIGTELHLRGTVDLEQVGKPVITPKHVRAEKK
jgi:hypothetical protein